MKYPKHVVDHFVAEEGLVLSRYLDTEQFATIGIGHKLLPHEMGLQIVTRNQAYAMLEADLDIATRSCVKLFPNFYKFPANTQLGILDMVFNLGENGFRQFSKTIQLLNEGKFQEASREALNSKWATQVPNRARRTARLLSGS
jgi:GH24 family phage-related lysozyme (muramidase)